MKKMLQKELLELVKSNYQDIGEQFNETRKKVPWEEVAELASQIPDGARILDVGCGNGRLLDCFVGKKVDYIGVDSSEKLIALAKQNYPEQRFEVLDMLNLSSLPDMEFDYVFCVAALHHLPSEEMRVSSLKQMKNKIKKDGLIFLTVWNMWGQTKMRILVWKFFLLKLIGKNEMDFGDVVFDWKNKDGHAISRRYYHAFRRRELYKLAEKAGLKIFEFGRNKRNYYLSLVKN